MRRDAIRGGSTLLLALVLAGCSGIQAPPPPSGPRPGEGRFVLYLNGPPAVPGEMTFELTSMDALAESGARLPLGVPSRHIGSLDVVGRQILLAEVFLPQGRYTKLGVNIAKARTRQEGRWLDLSVPPEGFLVDAGFEIRPGQATALFMSWDVGRSVEGQAFLRPAFAFSGPVQELRGVLAFVSNEGSDTISVIDRSVDRVVDVLAVGRAPRGLAVALDATKGYVVNSGSDSLSVVDINVTRVIHTTTLELGGRASDVALTPDGRTLYVTNTALNSVSALDAQSYQIVRTIPVGLRPTSLVMIPTRPALLVANMGSNDLSLIDTGRTAVAGTIPVDFQPSNLSVDSIGSQGFVPHLASPRLLVLSLAAMKPLRAVAAGTAAAALPEADGAVTRVYVARPRERRVTLVDVTLNAEVDSIPVGDEPWRLAIDPNREKLYVVNRGSGTVTVIDRFSRRVRATIEVGRRPYSIAIVP